VDVTPGFAAGEVEAGGSPVSGGEGEAKDGRNGQRSVLSWWGTARGADAFGDADHREQFADEDPTVPFPTLEMTGNDTNLRAGHQPD
jgi:hypothetical protein